MEHRGPSRLADPQDLVLLLQRDVLTSTDWGFTIQAGILSVPAMQALADYALARRRKGERPHKASIAALEAPAEVAGSFPASCCSDRRHPRVEASSAALALPAEVSGSVPASCCAIKSGERPAVQASRLLLRCRVASMLAAGKAGSHTKAGLDQLLGPAQQLLGMWNWHLAHEIHPQHDHIVSAVFSSWPGHATDGV